MGCRRSDRDDLIPRARQPSAKFQVGEIVERKIIRSIGNREGYRTVEEILPFPRSSELDANVKRVGLAKHVGALTKVNDTIGLYQRFSDEAVTSSDLQGAQLGLVVVHEQGAQVGGILG